MAVRPYWSGTIRVSLVSLSVEMFTAIDAGQKIAFHQIYKPAGERVRQKLVAGDVEVDRADIVKGYEVDKGEYVSFEPDEIKDLKIPSSKTMELVQFVPYDAVDAVYFYTPYYLAPSGKGDLATFSVIRDAMRERAQDRNRGSTESQGRQPDGRPARQPEGTRRQPGQ